MFVVFCAFHVFHVFFCVCFVCFVLVCLSFFDVWLFFCVWWCLLFVMFWRAFFFGGVCIFLCTQLFFVCVLVFVWNVLRCFKRVCSRGLF